MINYFFIPFFTVLFSLIALDMFWLTLFKDFYISHLESYLNETPKLFPIILFYLLYALGLTMFIVIPALQTHLSIASIITRSLLFGLVAYGTYNLTNFATIKGWPVAITILDLAWGAGLTALASIFSVYLTRYINSGF